MKQGYKLRLLEKTKYLHTTKLKHVRSYVKFEVVVVVFRNFDTQHQTQSPLFTFVVIIIILLLLLPFS